MKEIKLSGKYGVGKYALVDDDTYDKVQKYHWHVNSVGYPQRSYRINYKRFNQKLHHFIIGKPSGGLVTDHINRNKLDNRKINLRHTTVSQNIINSKLRKDNKSGYRGIRKVQRGNYERWQAYVSINGKHKHMGYFKNKKEAVSFRKEWMSLSH